MLDGRVVTWGVDGVDTVQVAAGLSVAELTQAEERYGFSFPPDLRELLSTGLPTGGLFPNWRSDEGNLRAQMESPVRGLLFDVEHSSLWLEEWGTKPGNIGLAVALAERQLGAVPLLIPVFGHRYLPSEPNKPGNPVLSVHQSDIIRYGRNLTEYFGVEFGARPLPEGLPDRAAIPFWGQLVS